MWICLFVSSFIIISNNVIVIIIFLQVNVITHYTATHDHIHLPFLESPRIFKCQILFVHKIYKYRIPNTIRSWKFTNTEYRIVFVTSKSTNTEYRIVFVTSKSTNTEYRIVLFGPNYSRIPNNRIIRCNSVTEWYFRIVY